MRGHRVTTNDMSLSFRRDMDFLSFCPLLVDILQFVDYKDIPNCKLVNKRIDDVIQQNSLSMPRKQDKLLIWWHSDKGYISVSDLHFSYEVFITDKTTLLFQNRPSTLEYYKNSGKAFISSPGSTKEEIIEKTQASYHLEEEDFANSVSYRNNNLEDGLRTLLSFCLRRYYYTIIVIHSLPEELLPMLVDEVRQSRSRCRILSFFKVTQETYQLFQTLACSTLLIPYSEIGNLKKEIREVVNWNRLRRLEVVNVFDYAKELQNILQQLLSGGISLRTVTFKILCRFDLDDAMAYDYSMNDNSATRAAIIVQQIKDDADDNWDELKRDWKNKSFNKSFSIERSCDNTVFSLKVSHLHFSALYISIKQL